MIEWMKEGMNERRNERKKGRRKEGRKEGRKESQIKSHRNASVDSQSMTLTAQISSFCQRKCWKVPIWATRSYEQNHKTCMRKLQEEQELFSIYRFAKRSAYPGSSNECSRKNREMPVYQEFQNMVQNRKKNRKNSHQINHYPTSDEVSEVNEQISGHVSEASRAEQANEWAVRANERTDKRVAQYCSLYFWLF